MTRSGRKQRDYWDVTTVIKSRPAEWSCNPVNVPENQTKNRRTMEKYSVLMSLYKKEKPEYLRLSIDSMLNQTVKPDEIVLVEDGPLTEELYAVLDEYGDKLTRIRNKKNLGLGLALNVGLKACRNELVARMDTDDISKTERCEKQLHYFEQHSETDIVGGDIAEFIGDESNIVGKRVVPQTNEEIREYMKKRCAFNHMSVMYKKGSVQAAGGYQDWFWNEDYYLWIRMLLNGAVFANTGTVLVDVRTGKEMYQRRGGKKYFKSEVRLQWFMLKNHLIGFPRCILNVAQRLILQVLMPSKVRGIVFRTFARQRE